MKKIIITICMFFLAVSCSTGLGNPTIGVSDSDNFLKGSIRNNKGELVKGAKIILYKESNELVLMKTLGTLEKLDSIVSVDGSFEFTVNEEGVYSIKAFFRDSIIAEKLQFQYKLGDVVDLVTFANQVVVDVDLSLFKTGYINNQGHFSKSELWKSKLQEDYYIVGNFFNYPLSDLVNEVGFYKIYYTNDDLGETSDTTDYIRIYDVVNLEYIGLPGKQSNVSIAIVESEDESEMKVEVLLGETHLFEVKNSEIVLNTCETSGNYRANFDSVYVESGKAILIGMTDLKYASTYICLHLDSIDMNKLPIPNPEIITSACFGAGDLKQKDYLLKFENLVDLEVTINTTEQISDLVLMEELNLTTLQLHFIDHSMSYSLPDLSNLQCKQLIIDGESISSIPHYTKINCEELLLPNNTTSFEVRYCDIMGEINVTSSIIDTLKIQMSQIESYKNVKNLSDLSALYFINVDCGDSIFDFSSFTYNEFCEMYLNFNNSALLDVSNMSNVSSYRLETGNEFLKSSFTGVELFTSITFYSDERVDLSEVDKVMRSEGEIEAYIPIVDDVTLQSLKEKNISCSWLD